MKWPPKLSAYHHNPSWRTTTSSNGGWAITPPGLEHVRVLRGKSGMLCIYCCAPMNKRPNDERRVTKDHIFPKSRGHALDGLNGFNKAFVCYKCNQSKKHYDIIEWWWRLEHGNDTRAPTVFRLIETLHFHAQLPNGTSLEYKELRNRLGWPNAGTG
jgi:HNH endonuclease